MSDLFHHNLLETLLEELRGLRVACPGRIETYDPEKQLASVKPLLRRPRYDEEDQRIYEGEPIVHGVPVWFPGDEDFDITWPVKPGAKCLLVFCHAPLEQWLKNGDEVDPGEAAPGGLYPVAYVGLRDAGHPRPLPPADGIALRAKGGCSVVVKKDRVEIAGAQHSVALAEPLSTFIDALLESLAGASNTGGTVAYTPPLPDAPTIASSKAKVAP